jgi:hypothetical protein
MEKFIDKNGDIWFLKSILQTLPDLEALSFGNLKYSQHDDVESNMVEQKKVTKIKALKIRAYGMRNSSCGSMEKKE